MLGKAIVLILLYLCHPRPENGFKIREVRDTIHRIASLKNRGDARAAFTPRGAVRSWHPRLFHPCVFPRVTPCEVSPCADDLSP